MICVAFCYPFLTLLLPSFHSFSTATSSEVLTFLFAGQDSTAAAMASCLCFLTASPRCKAKLLQERPDDISGGVGKIWGWFGGEVHNVSEWFMFDHIFMSSGSKIPASVMFMCMFLQKDWYLHSRFSSSYITVMVLSIHSCWSKLIERGGASLFDTPDSSKPVWIWNLHAPIWCMGWLLGGPAIGWLFWVQFSIKQMFLSRTRELHLPPCQWAIFGYVMLYIISYKTLTTFHSTFRVMAGDWWCRWNRAVPWIPWGTFWNQRELMPL